MPQPAPPTLLGVPNDDFLKFSGYANLPKELRYVGTCLVGICIVNVVEDRATCGPVITDCRRGVAELKR